MQPSINPAGGSDSWGQRILVFSVLISMFGQASDRSYAVRALNQSGQMKVESPMTEITSMSRFSMIELLVGMSP